MYRSLFVLLAVSLMFTSSRLYAQSAPSAGSSPSAGQLGSWLKEYRQIQSELEWIENLALRDSALRAQNQALGREVQVAIQKADPELETAVARLAELKRQSERAREKGAAKEMVRIQGEAGALRQRLAVAREKALRDPDLQVRVERFNTALRAKMLEVHPDTETLLSRFRTLTERLSRIPEDAS